MRSRCFHLSEDGTLMYIKAPTIDERGYIGRKKCHALNIQCACDENCLFLNVVAKWLDSHAIHSY